MKRRKARNRLGASMMALSFSIAFFIILPLCLLGFEIARFYLLQTQLEHVAGACALAGTGAIATIPTGSGSPTGSTLENLYNGCAQEAVYCLQLNTILGQNMASALSSGNIQVNPGITNGTVSIPPPAAGQAAIAINFLNIDGSYHQNLQTSGAVKMRVDLAFSTTPIFEGLVSLHIMPLVTAFANATGGLPQLDVFLCFDLSGSMDDQTTVAFVRRFWDTTLPGGGGVNYTVLSLPSNLPAPAAATVQSGTIFNLTNCAYVSGGNQYGITGTQLNVCPPQNLVYSYSQAGSNTPWWYGALRSASSGSGTPPEQGQVPGNVTISSGGTATPVAGFVLDPYGPSDPSYTDMVYVSGAVSTQTCAIEVEASRGNLESTAILTQALGGTTYAQNNLYWTALSGAAGAGNYTSYWFNAYTNSAPLYQAVQAGSNFITTMNLSTDARFGLCCFSTNASSASGQTYPSGGGDLLISASGPSYPGGGAPPGGTFPLPYVSLSSGTSSYTNASAALAVPTAYNPLTNSTTVTATGETDIYDALNAAFTDVQANARSTAKKAVVLFTDGVPTAPPNAPSPGIPNNSNSSIETLVTTSVGVGAQNVPVYCIGLAQGGNTTLQNEESTLLSAIVSDAGQPSGQYIPITTGAQLDGAFQTIARGLVLLTGQ